MSKRTPRGALVALTRQYANDEINHVAAMSLDDLKAELRTHGVDVDAELARGRAWRRDAALGNAPKVAPIAMLPTAAKSPAKLVSIAAKHRRIELWAAIAAAAALASLSGVAFVPRVHHETGPMNTPRTGSGTKTVVSEVHHPTSEIAVVAPPVQHPVPELGTAPPVMHGAHVHSSPADLRREALIACDASRWNECLQRLDDARRLDPGGDGAATVRRLRQRATDALRTAPEGEL